MRLPMQEIVPALAGTTVKATWVNSGVLPNSGYITSVLLDRNENVVSTFAVVASGNGFYFSLLAVPATPGYYVNEWVAAIAVNTYVNRQWIRAYKGDV